MTSQKTLRAVSEEVARHRKSIGNDARRAVREERGWTRVCGECQERKASDAYALNLWDEQDMQSTCRKCNSRLAQERKAGPTNNLEVVSQTYAKSSRLMSDEDFDRIVTLLEMEPRVVDRVLCALELRWGVRSDDD